MKLQRIERDHILLRDLERLYGGDFKDDYDFIMIRTA